ncbi:MAG: response regulator, partial [Calditrichia bacterium]|nr:response regulator [Calditrichia bacterium]
DTGIGIPEMDQMNIFDSFSQHHSQIDKEYGGSGLGLSITKRLVEMMNGKISLNSEFGKGSLFEITLYDVKISSGGIYQKEEKILDINNLSFEPATVLIVDDVESNRTFIKELLTEMKLNVLEAANGQNALLIAEESKPAIIIMDIRMPVMDGFEATERLKSNLCTKDIPVIALSASSKITERDKMIKLGFDGYLSKPVRIYNLINELTHFLKFYQKSKPKEEKKLIEKLDAENIVQIKELTDILQNTMMPEWEKIHGVMDTSVVENFAVRIKSLGKDHNVEIFNVYAKDLLHHVQTFDIANIEIALSKFPEIVKILVDLKEKYDE